MFKDKKCKKIIFWRNCLLLYIFVGLCSALISDVYKNFQVSNQSANANKFSRLVSVRVAYNVKEHLLK